MIAATATEFAKLIRATVVRAASVIIVLGIAVLCAAMLLAAGTDDPQLAAKLGPLSDPGGWTGYFAAAGQITAAGGLLGFGVVLSWLFGREFADGTIVGLFALPVSRQSIAAAKLVVYTVWAVVVSAALLAALIVSGFACGLGPMADDAAAAMGRQFVLALLTAVIAAPAAWAATLGRSMLTGIAVTIGILVAAQVAVVGGAGAWLPFSSPALWALSNGADVSIGQLTLIVPVVGVSALLTLRAWQRLQLDR